MIPPLDIWMFASGIGTVATTRMIDPVVPRIEAVGIGATPLIRAPPRSTTLGIGIVAAIRPLTGDEIRISAAGIGALATISIIPVVVPDMLSVGIGA